MPVGAVVRDDESRTFFEGAAQGDFVLRVCPDGHISSPSSASCETCGSPELHGTSASGRATLVSWAVLPDRGDGGAVLAIGELAEGPWWWSRLEGTTDADLRAGAPLRVSFRAYDDAHEQVPVFEPA